MGLMHFGANSTWTGLAKCCFLHFLTQALGKLFVLSSRLAEEHIWRVVHTATGLGGIYFRTYKQYHCLIICICDMTSI